MVDEWTPVLTQAGVLHRFHTQGVCDEHARLQAAASKELTSPRQRAARVQEVPPAFWANEETRYALERMAGRRARNNRWAELSQRRAHLATGSHAWPPRARPSSAPAATATPSAGDSGSGREARQQVPCAICH